MSVEVTFLPQGRSGLVAENSYLVDAARRMGVEVLTDCGRRGECNSCAIFVESGATLLSTLTEPEIAHLDADKLGRGARLACQAQVVQSGSIVLRSEVVEPPPKEERNISEEFSNLPLAKKVSALFEFEAVTLVQALNAIIDVPYKAAGKALEFAAIRGKKLDQEDRQAKHQSASQTPEAQESDLEN